MYIQLHIKYLEHSPHNCEKDLSIIYFLKTLFKEAHNSFLTLECLF